MGLMPSWLVDVAVLAPWIWLLGWVVTERVLPQVSEHVEGLLGPRVARLARWLPLTWPVVVWYLLRWLSLTEPGEESE